MRSDCAPNGSDQQSCEAKGCRWSKSQTPNVPWCYYDPTLKNFGYKMDASDTQPQTMQQNALDLILTIPPENAETGSYSTPIANVGVTMRKIDQNIFRIKLTDKDSQRYEIPEEADIYQSPNEGRLTIMFNIPLY